MTRTRSMASLSMVLFALGCSSGTDEETVGDDPAVERCASVEGTDQYSAGMSKTGENGISVAIADAQPAPPAQFDNTWTLAVADSSGAPLEGAAVTVEPFMPEHGHGSNRTPVIEEVGDGTFKVERVSLTMPGFWQVTVKVETASVSDSVKFSFCVD